MSVLIKGMKMPDRCSKCLISDVTETSDHIVWCRLIKAYIVDVKEERPRSCPLMEINIKQEDEE